MTTANISALKMAHLLLAELPTEDDTSFASFCLLLSQEINEWNLIKLTTTEKK